MTVALVFFSSSAIFLILPIAKGAVSNKHVRNFHIQSLHSYYSQEILLVCLFSQPQAYLCALFTLTSSEACWWFSYTAIHFHYLRVLSVNMRHNTLVPFLFFFIFFFSWSCPVNKHTVPLTSDKEQSFMEQWMDQLSKRGSAAVILGYGFLWILDPSYLMCRLAPWLIFKPVSNCTEATSAFGQRNHMSRCEVT